VYVETILSNNGSAVVGSLDDPLRIDLEAEQLFTEEVAHILERNVIFGKFEISINLKPYK
jgi:hypothetical protein